MACRPCERKQSRVIDEVIEDTKPAARMKPTVPNRDKALPIHADPRAARPPLVRKQGDGPGTAELLIAFDPNLNSTTPRQPRPSRRPRDSSRDSHGPRDSHSPRDGPETLRIVRGGNGFRVGRPSNFDVVAVTEKLYQD